MGVFLYHGLYYSSSDIASQRFCCFGLDLVDFGRAGAAVVVAGSCFAAVPVGLYFAVARTARFDTVVVVAVVARIAASFVAAVAGIVGLLPGLRSGRGCWAVAGCVLGSQLYRLG